MSYEKKPAWWFFWLVVAPYMLQCILWAAMLFEREHRTNFGFTILASGMLTGGWMHIAVPDHSLYEFVTFQGKEQRVRRSVQSGMRVCVVVFTIVELVLFVAGLFLHMKLKCVFPILHACSLYYFILGLLNVLRYEEIQYDVCYYEARNRIDAFHDENKLGFITKHTYRDPFGCPILDILIWGTGILLYWGVHSLLM